MLAVLTVASGASAAHAAEVALRVEGLQGTLITGPVATGAAVVNKDGQAGHDCPGGSGAGALEVGTSGNWSGTWFDGFGYTVDEVLDETHLFSSGRYWEYWLNDEFSQVGICETVANADRMLLFPQCADATKCGASLKPIGIEVPARATRGQAFPVRSYILNGQDATTPAPNVLIEGGGTSARTDAAGNAVMVLPNGRFGLRGSGDGYVRSATHSVCVSDDGFGTCGPEPVTPPPGQTGAQTPGSSTGGGSTGGGSTGGASTPARAASIEGFTGIRHRQIFGSGRGPRVLEGEIDPGTRGIHSVKVLLRRQSRGRCSYFSGRQERFRGMRCGDEGHFFRLASTDADWSYLLPRRLPRGRYVLLTKVIDRAFNRDERFQAGRNLAVFFVR